MTRHTPIFTAEIPAYALYGEANAEIPYGVHAETIHARSSKLDWRIAPHRHAGLYQCIWIGRGSARALLEESEITLPAGSFVFLPPLAVHGYRFSADTAGIVVSMPAAVLRENLAPVSGIMETLSRPVVATPEAFADIQAEEGESLFRTLLAEHGGFRPGRDAALAARATLVALWFARLAVRDETAPSQSTGVAAVRRFLAEVERHYTQNRNVQDYARSVGVSASHLGRLCRQVTGRAPLELVHDRRLIEAKRLLAYTATPISEVAIRLGFDSANYFSRFFRSRTGNSPRQFRRVADSGERI